MFFEVYLDMKFEKRAALSLLCEEIENEGDNLQLTIITVWSSDSSESNSVYGVANVFLSPMVENLCNILRHV